MEVIWFLKEIQELNAYWPLISKIEHRLLPLDKMCGLNSFIHPAVSFVLILLIDSITCLADTLEYKCLIQYKFYHFNEKKNTPFFFVLYKLIKGENVGYEKQVTLHTFIVSLIDCDS